MLGCYYPIRWNNGGLECMDDGLGGCVRRPCVATCKTLVESTLVPAVVPVTAKMLKNFQCGELDPLSEMMRLQDHPGGNFAWQQGSTQTLPPSASGVKYPDISRNELYNAILFQTNVIRKAYGLKEIAWDQPAQTDLDRWAATCPGQVHGGPKSWANYAQNVAVLNTSACKSVATCKAMDTPAYLWFSVEEPLWSYASSKCTQNWEACGHFANMMGPGIKYMACGSAQCPTGQGPKTFVWCNYRSPSSSPSLTRPSDFDKIKFLVHM